MPVKVGCAPDYNKNHPERIQKKRDEETVALVANKRFGWVDCDEHFTELAPRMPHTMNGKIVGGLLAIGKNSQVNIQQK